MQPTGPDERTDTEMQPTGPDQGTDTVYLDDVAVANLNASAPTPNWSSPVLSNDDWTGSSGALWNSSKWATTTNDSQKIADIQSNQGRFYVNGASARGTAQMTAVADSEVTGTYRFNERTSGSFLRIVLRAWAATD
jgi:hypothetical protein